MHHIWGIMCWDLQEHFIYRYVKIKTSDLEAKNQRMNKTMDSLLPIDKYFKVIGECLKYKVNRKTSYTMAQVIQKSHHAVLASALYIHLCKEWRKKPVGDQTCTNFKKLFSVDYCDIKLVKNLNAGQSGYHRSNAMIPTYDIASALDKIAMATTDNQGQVLQFMGTIHQLTETKKVCPNK